MSEEQKKNQQFSSPDGEGKASGAARSGRNHRHHHRGGKRSAGSSDSASRQNTPADSSGQNRPQEANDRQKSDPGATDAAREKKAKNGKPASEQKNNGQNQNGRNKNRRNRHRGRGENGPNQGIEDLYGTPTEADSLSLDELRARIVLRSADGTVPEAFREKQPVSEEKIELPIPEEDLLSSMPTTFSLQEIPEEDRIEIIGVRFRHSGRSYYFDPKGIAVKKGDHVIVETTRGQEFGEVYFGSRIVNRNNTITPLRPLLRIATQEDEEQNRKNRTDEQDSLAICRQKIAEHKLDMRLIDAEYAFDRSKIIFYFTADGRVDFRELVRDLAGIFRTRIELRQIGIRDEARLLGGLATCGRPLCCASFLPDFTQVSIRMAKDQGLSLNSAKISGICGRLMCCLRYETESYAEEIRRTPPVDATVQTPDGVGTVVGINPIAGIVRVLLKDSQEAPKSYARDAVTVLSASKKDVGANPDENPEKN